MSALPMIDIDDPPDLDDLGIVESMPADAADVRPDRLTIGTKVQSKLGLLPRTNLTARPAFSLDLRTYQSALILT